MKEPIFEIKHGDNHYKIYENGMIEGFPEGCYIVNRIQIAMLDKFAKWIESTKNQRDETDRNVSTSPLSPAKYATSSMVGCSQGTPS